MITLCIHLFLLGIVLVSTISALLMNLAAYSFAVGEECAIL